MSITAMKQALEALDYGFVDDPSQHKEREAITALRAAISEHEKCEPVAWLDITENRPVELLLGEQVQAAKEGGAGHWLKQRLRPLYTHPAPVPAGWQLVPVEPTEAMKVAGSDALGVYHCGSPSDIYKVMLQAAPKPGESHD